MYRSTGVSKGIGDFDAWAGNLRIHRDILYASIWQLKSKNGLIYCSRARHLKVKSATSKRFAFYCHLPAITKHTTTHFKEYQVCNTILRNF